MYCDFLRRHRKASPHNKKNIDSFPSVFPSNSFLLMLLLLLLLLALSCCSGRARNIKNNICSWPSLSQLSIYAPACGRGRRAEGETDRGTDGRMDGQLANYVRKATTFHGLARLSAYTLPSGTYQFTQQQKITLQTTNQTVAHNRCCID